MPKWPDRLVYAAFCLSCTLYASAAFYGYMLAQTHGSWSLPLDDAFIHFDYARSLARGAPFEWCAGNGFSSGNTSLTYPLVLALGYGLGFRELSLIRWAVIVSDGAVALFLIQAGRLADSLPQRLNPESGSSEAGVGYSWVKYLFPPAVLSMGALDWTLWSGMENAWHLGVWSMALAALDRQLAAPDLPAMRRRALWTGAAGALLVATRPESAVCAASFAVFGAWYASRPSDLRCRPGGRAARGRRARDVLSLLIAAGAPSLVLLAAQAAANRALTGEAAPSGAIAKLLVYQPYLTAADQWASYRDLLDYIVRRLIDHHFADAKPWGWLVVGLALLPLASARLRPLAFLLWAQIGGWILLIAVNMQVRWQNERYAMPAVAWLMLLAAQGLGLIAQGAAGRPQSAVRAIVARSQPIRALGAAALAGLYWLHQRPNMLDQIWFFGRACRNIRDQHMRAGALLAQLGVRRVLVGDAGALIYVSDLPGVDLIGLGGFHRYPFARATLNGLGAAIEQIERMPEGDRPDAMAIYPSWWGDLPTFFGQFVAAVPAPGNVICGARDKVIYRADWRALDRRGRPRSLGLGERVADEIDLGDLVSERAHGLDLPRPRAGFVAFRVLPDPADRSRDLFDAGRILPAGQRVRATIAPRRRGGRLIARLAPDRPIRIQVRVAGTSIEPLKAEPAGGWIEISSALPPGLPERAQVELTAGGDATVFHLWVVE